MKKLLSLCLALCMAVGLTVIPLNAVADRAVTKRYLFETEALPSDCISYTPGAAQDFFDYGNGVSGSYIRVENTPGKAGNFVELTLDVPETASYTVSYSYRVHWISGVNQLSINGTAVGEARDFNDRTYGNENDMATAEFKNVELSAGKNVFRWETTQVSEVKEGANKGSYDRITIDYVMLTPTDYEIVGYDNEVVFVSDMDYFDLHQYADPDHIGMVFQSGGTLTFDMCSCNKQPIMLDGIEYTKGFGFEPNDKTTGVLDIPIPSKAESFKTAVGINDHKNNSNYDQKNVVTFLIDGKEAYVTDPLTFGHTEYIDLKIPYGSKTLTIKNDCGVSSENDHICFGDARFDIGTASDVAFDIEISEGLTLSSGRQIYIMMPEDTDVTALQPKLTVCETSSCTPSAGEAVDFSAPVTYTVTSGNGQTADYTVTVYAKRPLTAEEAAAVSGVEQKISEISDEVSMSDRQAVKEARAAFDALDGREKLSVQSHDRLTAAEAAIEKLLNEPIKISCVGDSITWGGVAEKSYPVNLQEILGDDYRIYNGGVGGTCASKSSNYPYWSTASYRRSKEFQPDYVLIMFGTNDAQDFNWNNCKDKIENDYRELIAQYTGLDSHPTIVLASPAWYHRDAGSNMGNAINKTIAEMVERLAKEYGFDFVDINAVTENHPEWFQRDGIHPDDDGYRAVAEAFAEVFLPKNEASLSSAELDGKTLADFTESKQNAVLVEGTVLPEQLTLVSTGTTDIKFDTKGPMTSVGITVTSSNGRYKNNYRLTMIDRSRRGDMDLNGIRNVSDILTLKQLIMSGGYDEEQLLLGDMDENKSINVSDILTLKNIIMSGE